MEDNKSYFDGGRPHWHRRTEDATTHPLDFDDAKPDAPL